jgi:hypothetical protein
MIPSLAPPLNPTSKYSKRMKNQLRKDLESLILVLSTTFGMKYTCRIPAKAAEQNIFMRRNTLAAEISSSYWSGKIHQLLL